MKKMWRTILVLLILIFTYVLINGTIICIYSTRDETRRADTAIVLGAGTYNGEVSPVYQERLNHAIRLYEQGYVGTIIPTGGVGEGSNQADAEAAKVYLTERGIPEDIIFPEDDSSVTQENLVNAKAIMDEKDLKTALVVSDPLHMKRAMFLAKDAGLEAYTCPTTTSRYMTLKTQIPFLLREIFFFTGYQWFVIFL